MFLAVSANFSIYIITAFDHWKQLCLRWQFLHWYKHTIMPKIQPLCWLTILLRFMNMYILFVHLFTSTINYGIFFFKVNTHLLCAPIVLLYDGPCNKLSELYENFVIKGAHCCRYLRTFLQVIRHN